MVHPDKVEHRDLMVKLADEAQMSNKKEKERRMKEVEKSHAYSKNIAEDPDSYLEAYKDGQRKIGFAAGGGLVKEFGKKESKIWQAMESTANNLGSKLSVAGIEFSINELGLMGDFYRWLADTKNVTFHCIDERLVEDGAHAHVEVHCECGACNAINAALSVEAATALLGDENRLEDVLYTELAKGNKDIPEKQQLLTGMENDHESLSIYVNLSTTPRDIAAAKKAEAQEAFGLPFSVWLPIEYMVEYIEDVLNIKENATGYYEKLDELTSVLVRWNVQIAQNIIGGHHNLLAHSSSSSVLLVDARQVNNGADEQSKPNQPNPMMGKIHLAQSVVRKKMTNVISADRWMEVGQA